MNLYVDRVSFDLWTRALYCTFYNEINLKSIPSLYIIMLLLHLTSRTTLSLSPPLSLPPPLLTSGLLIVQSDP